MNNPLDHESPASWQKANRRTVTPISGKKVAGEVRFSVNRDRIIKQEKVNMPFAHLMLRKIGGYDYQFYGDVHAPGFKKYFDATLHETDVKKIFKIEGIGDIIYGNVTRRGNIITIENFGFRFKLEEFVIEEVRKLIEAEKVLRKREQK